MPITEIALLNLLSPTTVDDASLRSKLARAKSVMEGFTGRHFHYLQQIEDPSMIYVIGEWDSLDQHMNEFIPSAENQSLLEQLKTELAVVWLLHIDAPHAKLPIPTILDSQMGTASHVVSIVRHFVKSGEKETFRETYEGNKHYLQDFITEGRIGAGWRIDPEDGKDEFVLWSPWRDVEQHHRFAETEGFEEYGKIRDSLDGAEIKHAKPIDI